MVEVMSPAVARWKGPVGDWAATRMGPALIEASTSIGQQMHRMLPAEREEATKVIDELGAAMDHMVKMLPYGLAAGTANAQMLAWGHDAINDAITSATNLSCRDAVADLIKMDQTLNTSYMGTP